MNKPIKDYTLGEVKEICNKYMADYETLCVGCPLKQWCDEMTETGDYVPGDWDLSEPPRFTQEEAERAKMLYSVGILEVKRMAHGSDIFAYAAQNRVGHSAVQRAWSLPEEFFPSIQPGEIVKLEDIINSGQEER